MVFGERNLPTIELTCIGDADFEAQARQLEILARELNVLSLNALLRLGPEHADIGHARLEHDIEHVGEVAVLASDLAQLS